MNDHIEYRVMCGQCLEEVEVWPDPGPPVSVVPNDDDTTETCVVCGRLTGGLAVFEWPPDDGRSLVDRPAGPLTHRWIMPRKNGKAPTV